MPPLAIYDDDLDFAESRRLLAQCGVALVALADADPADLQRAVGLLCSFRRLSRDDLDLFPALRVVSLSATGSSLVDAAECGRRSIHLLAIPDPPPDEVATHALALILDGCRRLTTLQQRVRAGDWTYQDLPISSPSTQTLGILGLGRVGSAVAAIAAPLFSRTVAHDVRPPSARQPNQSVRHVDLRTLVREADVISLHASHDASPTPILDRGLFSTMRPGVVIVNTARDHLIDEAALLEGLRDGRVGYAGLDVVDRRPTGLAAELAAEPNCVITPHCAFYSLQAGQFYVEAQAANLVEALRSEGQIPPVVAGNQTRR